MSFAASALTVYDTLGPDEPFYGRGWFFGAGCCETLVETAERFVPSASGLLDTVSLAISYANEVHFGVRVQLRLDDAGRPGAVVVETAVLPTSVASVVTVSFDGSMQLEQGQAYWLSLAADTDDPQGHTGGWGANQLGIGGTRAALGLYGVPPDQWFVYEVDDEMGAARITVSAVPEAPTLALWALGLAGLAAARLRTRRP